LKLQCILLPYLPYKNRQTTPQIQATKKALTSLRGLFIYCCVAN